MDGGRREQLKCEVILFCVLLLIVPQKVTRIICPTSDLCVNNIVIKDQSNLPEEL